MAGMHMVGYASVVVQDAVVPLTEVDFVFLPLLVAVAVVHLGECCSSVGAA